jgi:predicted acyltransferase
MIRIGDSNLQQWLFRDVFGAVSGPYLASFLFAFFFMLLNWTVGYFMDRNRIYVKV